MSHAFDHAHFGMNDNNVHVTAVYVKVFKEGQSQHRVPLIRAYLPLSFFGKCIVKNLSILAKSPIHGISGIPVLQRKFFIFVAQMY